MKERIAIIGGGIVGATAAYYLARQGYDLTLFDEGLGQASQAAAGIICPWLSLRRNKAWYYLVAQGAEFYQQFMADLQADGYDTESIYQIDGALMIRKDMKRVQRDLEQAKTKEADAPAMGEVKALTAQQVNELFPHIRSQQPATWVEGGGRVHGDSLIQTLHQAIAGHGGKLIKAKANLSHNGQRPVIRVESKDYGSFDKVLLAAGPWLPNILEDLDYQVDVRPQKGQLLVYHSEAWKDKHWPVVIPSGEGDIIPYNNGDLIIGASHEDDQGFDLTVDTARLENIRQQASQYLPDLLEEDAIEVKVGTRAHTSDFSVLVGQVPDLARVWAISGLGSSGLTSGPFLGYQWSQLITKGSWLINEADYPIDNYIRSKYNDK